MAKFKLTNTKIVKVAAGKQNAGEEYLIADLINQNCPYEPAQRFPCFIKGVVETVKQYLPVSKGGVAETEKPLPPEFEYVTGCFAEFTPPQKFYKEHLSDHEATATRPAIKAGDLVCKDGVPIVYESLRVFCLYYKDEEGHTQFVKGMSPTEAGMRAFGAYCRPISEERVADGTAISSSEDTFDKLKPKSAEQVAAESGMPSAPQGFIYTFGDDGKTPKLIPA